MTSINTQSDIHIVGGHVMGRVPPEQIARELESAYTSGDADRFHAFTMKAISARQLFAEQAIDQLETNSGRECALLAMVRADFDTVPHSGRWSSSGAVQMARLASRVENPVGALAEAIRAGKVTTARTIAAGLFSRQDRVQVMEDAAWRAILSSRSPKPENHERFIAALEALFPHKLPATHRLLRAGVEMGDSGVVRIMLERGAPLQSDRPSTDEPGYLEYPLLWIATETSQANADVASMLRIAHVAAQNAIR